MNNSMPSDQIYAALLRRDSALDGVLFSGVRTTGIYCRPVCKARVPLQKNITLYPTAAAAETAGYRPCLRCRPETTPFSPAWKGTQTTVNRALDLINDGALNTGTVCDLALRLGVSERHVSRLFAEHIGASPTQVSKTLRVQKAKRLLNTTPLPLSQIALQAGFPSQRSMRSAFLTLYGRPPSALRKQKAIKPLTPKETPHDPS